MFSQQSLPVFQLLCIEPGWILLLAHVYLTASTYPHQILARSVTRETPSRATSRSRWCRHRCDLSCSCLKLFCGKGKEGVRSRLPISLRCQRQIERGDFELCDSRYGGYVSVPSGNPGSSWIATLARFLRHESPSLPERGTKALSEGGKSKRNDGTPDREKLRCGSHNAGATCHRLMLRHFEHRLDATHRSRYTTPATPRGSKGGRRQVRGRPMPGDRSTMHRLRGPWINVEAISPSQRQAMSQ